MTHKYPLLAAWIFLIIAIMAEVIGSSFLKLGYEHDFKIILFSYQIDMTFLYTAFFICIAYYFIGLAMFKISIGIAYAIWEVLGIIFIVFIGVFYFKESLSIMQYCGIGLGILGIILINLGEIKD